MSKSVTYTFTAFGSTYNVVLNPNKYIDMIAEMSAAMAEANVEFLWKQSAFIKDSNGCWFDNGDKSYKWVEGNFFD